MTQLRNRKILLLIVMVAMTAAFTVISPYYLKLSNWMSILREASNVGILAIGMTFVIIVGGIDLSVGSVFSICAMLYVRLFEGTGLPTIVVMLIVILFSAAIGTLNGLAVTRLKVPDFIATLASMTILRGLTVIIAPRDMNGNVASINISNKTFSSLADKIGPIYIVFLVFVVLCVLAHLILKYTKLGTSVYALGANAKSAMLSGIDGRKIKLFTYMLSGLMAGIAATFYTARIRTATVDLGSGIETTVIAAVVVGGTSFAGGEGDIIGTAIGAIFLEALQNGLYKLDISATFDPIIIGCVIILSILLDSIFARFSGSKASAKVKRLQKGVGQSAK